MFRTFDFLHSNEVDQLMGLSNQLTFENGQSTNPDFDLKNNLQARRDQSYQQVANILHQATVRNEFFRDYSFAKNMAPPLMTKYEPGMKYGEHVDASIIPFKPALRSDLSMTIFLSDPSTYEGGELVIRLADRKIKVKEPAGRAILYPSVHYHGVAPVTSGTRVVAITFIESYVRDAAQREILVELQDFLHDHGSKFDTSELMRLEYVKQNLIRMWHGQ